MRRRNALLTKDINSLIKQIAIPSSIGMFFNTMYNVVDTFYAGMISTVSITALSYSFVVYFMLLSISFGFSSAITAHVGNSLGKKRFFLAKIYVSNGVTFVSFISISLSILGFIFLQTIFELMGAKDEPLNLAMEYTNIILIGVIPMLIGLAANAVLIAKGDTKSYRNSLIAGFFLNLILDPMFIYGFWFIPKMGLSGIALATILIQFGTLVYIFYKLSLTGLFNLNLSKLLLPDLRVYRRILKQAVPSSLNMFLMSFGTMIVTYFVSDYGYKAVAAFGIGYRVEQIVILPMLGLNTAVISIVSNNYGAKNFDRINEVIKKALTYGYMMSFAGMIIMLFLGKYLIMLFDTDPQVVDIGYLYVMIEGFVFFAYITIFISTSALQGIKKPYVIPYIGLYRQVLMPLITLSFFVKYMQSDITAIWVCIAAISYSAAIYIYFYSKKELSEAQNSK